MNDRFNSIESKLAELDAKILKIESDLKPLLPIIAKTSAIKKSEKK
jgi:hypothetical protein